MKYQQWFNCSCPKFKALTKVGSKHFSTFANLYNSVLKLGNSEKKPLELMLIFDWGRDSNFGNDKKSKFSKHTNTNGHLIFHAFFTNFHEYKSDPNKTDGSA